MPDTKYEQDTQRFFTTGLDLNRPIDAVKDGKVPFLQNLRVTTMGQIEIRPTLTAIDTTVVVGQTPVHSARRLNDPRNNTFTRIVGAGTHLASGQAAFSDIDSGYSGDPLALVPFRPEQSAASWMIVGDRSRTRKTDGTNVHQWGLPTPTSPPTSTLGGLSYKPGLALGTFTNAGTAGAVSTATRVNTTITKVLYESGTTGMANIRPASMANIGVGAILILDGNSANEFAVEEVFVASSSNTIASIIYDSGTTGLCSIALTTPMPELRPNAMMLLNGTEYVRVLSVIPAPASASASTSLGPSFRCSTVGTFAATNTAQAVASFRGLVQINVVDTDTITLDSVQSTVTVGLGTLSQTVAYDLTVAAGGVAIGPDDYMHISIRIDNPDNVSQVRVMMDVDASTNDFTRNYYFYTAKGSDLVPEGDNQYAELRFKILELERVGAAKFRNLSTVIAVRIEINASATAVVAFDSWSIGGGFGLDTASPQTIGTTSKSTAIPYQYRYRARVSSTGARSNPSPPTRGTVQAFRQGAFVGVTAYSLASEADVLDIERFGGEISDWHYVATIPNATSSYFDTVPDLVAVQNPLSLPEDYQPWPIIDVPRSGTTGTVAGTTVNDSGSNFNTSWAQGTIIKVSGIPYTIYRVISTSRLETYENMGSQSGVGWRVDEPLLVSQPLPCVWGPVEDVFFAVGDDVNPGRLYYTNPVAESVRETGYIDITSPSEPLMNGVVYNGRSYVWSSERMFQILATGNPDIPWRYEEIPNGKGLFTRWAITRQPGPEVQFLAKDGIYTTSGGSPQSLTDDDLFPLFPNEGKIGTATNGILAPNIVTANETSLRLDYYDDYLYFNYLDTSSNRRTLVYSAVTRGWFWDIYTPGVVFHYGEEGDGVHLILCGGADAVTGGIYSLNGSTSDNGSAVAYSLLTPSVNEGTPRLRKRYGDIMVDVNPAGSTVTMTPNTDNNTTSHTATVTTAATRTQVVCKYGALDQWVVAKNTGISITGSVSTSARPTFFIWEPRWTFEPASLAAFSWYIPPTTHGMPNYKSLGAARICHVATANLSLVVTVDGVAQTAITIAHNSGNYKETWFRFPVYKGKLLEYHLTSSAEFRLDGRDSFIEVKEWASDGKYNELRIFSDYAMIEG